MSRRQRSGHKPTLTIIYWRDIPAQVTARSGRTRVSEKLEHRFQVAIDGAATRAGKTSADDYLAEWREESQQCGSDLETAVTTKKRELEEGFTPELLRAHVRNEGWAPTESP